MFIATQLVNSLVHYLLLESLHHQKVVSINESIEILC
jgi:hypothetical protein